MILTCPVCFREHIKYPSEIHHTACSNACGQKLRFINITIQIPQETLTRLYITEQRGFRYIENETGVSIKTLRKLCTYFGIPIRKGSDAIKTQWVNADVRRIKTADRLRLITTGRPSWSKGRSKANDTSLLAVSQRRQGKGNPAYKHGNTKTNNKLRAKVGHRAWSIAVKKRDGSCRHCGSTEKLTAHHIKHFATFPEGRVDIHNGITLCHDCHMTEHRRVRRELKGVELPPILH